MRCSHVQRKHACPFTKDERPFDFRLETKIAENDVAIIKVVISNALRLRIS